MNYEIDFEKIMKLKEELFKSNNNASQFIETNNEYKVKNFVLSKRKYKYVGKIVHELKQEIKQKEMKILSLRKLYLMSRSDVHDNELRKLFDELAILKSKLSIINDNKQCLFISSNEKTTNTNKPKPTNVLTAQQKKKIKKFLFDTYEQCSSNKRSEPFYMNKEDIIQHIKNHNQDILNKMPKKFEKLKKTDLCKVIFS